MGMGINWENLSLKYQKGKPNSDTQEKNEQNITSKPIELVRKNNRWEEVYEKIERCQEMEERIKQFFDQITALATKSEVNSIVVNYYQSLSSQINYLKSKIEAIKILENRLNIFNPIISSMPDNIKVLENKIRAFEQEIARARNEWDIIVGLAENKLKIAKKIERTGVS